MEPLRNLFTVRDAECEKHGRFESRNLYRTVWSVCPACEQDRRDAEVLHDMQIGLEQDKAKHKAMLDAAAIPQRFIGRDFENFSAQTDGQRRALTVSRDFAESFPEHRRKGSGLIFAGLPGTGKSHLAAAILQVAMLGGKNAVAYTTCLDMIRSVRDTWRRDSVRSETQVLNHLQGLDLLAIDEVGVQYGTDGEQTILFDVLDRRYREMKPTILLTNQDSDGFKGFIGERTYDRLKETTRWVAFDWPSHRPQARRDAA